MRLRILIRPDDGRITIDGAIRGARQAQTLADTIDGIKTDLLARLCIGSSTPECALQPIKRREHGTETCHVDGARKVDAGITLVKTNS